ncbi:MAG: hypothetical protein ACR652_18620 [Methylocystis sp.]|uniref:hypothetical protein n=1 Tax=Methylocystis sp. TaxID=1911079 RepID=UPI003DA4EB76
MTTTQFKKGDKVIRFRRWNDNGVWLWERLTIQSWGKKQGTATQDNTDEFVEDRFYVDQVNNAPYRDHLYLADGLDIEKVGLELAAAFLVYEIEAAKARIARYSAQGYDVKSNEKELAALEAATPRIANRLDLVAELRVR